MTATFDAAVPADTKIEVTKGTSVIDGKATITDSTVVFDATANLTAGTYTMTATLGEAKASKDVEVKDSYVAEIKVLNEVALTGKKPGLDKDATAAYIYYDVLNQYGESIRTSETIEWTTAPDNKTVDKAAGKITVTKDDGFTYGSQIYVTGVHVKSGQAYTGSVTVGMAQAVDSIKFAGFLSKNDKTKKLEALPNDFAKNTYYLLYKTFDQNGNPLDVTDPEYTSNNLTFICDSPLVMEIDTKTTNVFTVDGEEYAAVAVEPGQYVDKGGEVNITAISNKTGTKTTQNYVIGDAGLLQSLVLTTPASVVADGDSDVKIPYTAKDTKGNVITNYETIARSTNTLSLSASEDTELVLKEENDGTAGIYWSDAAKYDPKDSATYGQSDVCNDVSRNISLTTVVVGGESNNMMLQVSDIRRPSAIKSVKLTDDNNDTVVEGYEGTIGYSTEWDSDITFLDQYGAALDSKKAAAFFQHTKDNKFGKSSDAGYYGIKLEAKGADYLNVVSGGALTYQENISYKVSNVTEPTTETVKYSIVKTGSDNSWVDVSKVKSIAYTILPVKSVKNYTISNIARQEIKTSYSDATNGKDIEKQGDAVGVAEVQQAGDYACFAVTGTYDGKTVTIPTVHYAASTEEDNVSQFDIDKKNNNSGENVCGYLTETTNVSGSALTWKDLYDFNSYASPRKDAELNLVLTITKSAGNTEPASKSVVVSDEASTVAGVKITYPYNYATREFTLNPNLTKFNDSGLSHGSDASWASHSGNIVGVCGYEWAHLDPYTPVVYAVDQYGKTVNVKIEFTVSDIVENTNSLAHVPNNFVVNKNGTADANIEGAEIGDTFTLTAKVAGKKITDSVKVTVGADKAAYIDQNGNGTKAGKDKDGKDVPGTKDTGLRELLGYKR